MEQKKNLCAQIPLSLHAQVCEARETAGQTTSEYITNLLIEYYNLKKDGGTTTMSGKTRTMAFQIPEELFQRIKAHLERKTQRTGRKLTQREFVLGLIEEALRRPDRPPPRPASALVRTMIPRRRPCPRKSPDTPQRPPCDPVEALAPQGPRHPNAKGIPGAFFVPSRARQTLKFNWR